MIIKKLAIGCIVLALVVMIAQLVAFGVQWARAANVLDRAMLTYEEVDRDEFVHQLIQDYDRLGIRIERNQIEIEEDRDRRTLRVEVRYTTRLDILAISQPKEMRVWRTLRNVSF